MPTQSDSNSPRRRNRRRRSIRPAFLISCAALAVILVGLLILGLRGCFTAGGEPSPTPASPTVPATPTPTVPAATPTPTLTPPPLPTPTPEPAPVYDFSQPAPERETVGDDYFTDAVFIGDSRTDGLKLFGGIPDTTFLYYNGITVFEVGDSKKGVRIDGQKYSILDALALKQYKKVYIALGVNELGYFNDPWFESEYAGFVDKVREIQPNAVIYLQNLVVINPDKAKANDQPYYITNDQIAIYNEIITRIAADKKAVLVDVNDGLTDENGALLRENTTDGVHFSKEHYKKWYEYLKTHTVDDELYWANQSAQ